MCGEKQHKYNGNYGYYGSPPHVRGKGPEKPPRCLWGWITPACAGKSDIPLLHTVSESDHPRMCGEKSQTTLI